MTSPLIVPGPFSFLADIGKAGGAAFAAHTADVDQKKKDALQRAMLWFDMRQKGLIGPETATHPDVMQMFSAAGLPAPQATATPEDLRASTLRRFIQPDAKGTVAGGPLAAPININTGPQSVTPEARAATGLPTAGAMSSDALLASRNASLAPEAGATALSDQQTAQDKTFNDVADRIVAAEYSRANAGVSSGELGKLPTIEQVTSAGAVDPRAKMFGDRITPNYYEQALARLRDQLFASKTGRLTAMARVQAAGQGADNQQVKLLGQINSMSTASQKVIDKYEIMGQPIAPQNPEYLAAKARKATLDQAAIAISSGQTVSPDAAAILQTGSVAATPDPQRVAAYTNAYKAIKAGKQHPKFPRHAGETDDQYMTRLYGAQP